MTARRFRGLTGEAIRYVIVGGGTYVADFLIYLLVVTLAPTMYLQGNVAGRLTGAVIGFVMHKYWTFGGQHSRSIVTQALSYALLLFLNIGLSSALLMGFNTYRPDIGPVLARVITDILVIGFTFIFSKLIFKHQATSDDAPSLVMRGAGNQPERPTNE